MLRYDPEYDYRTPVYTDNRRFREDIPEIGQHFAEAEREMQRFRRVDGVITSPEIVDFVDCPVCESILHDQLFVKYGLIYEECSVCSHVFVRNRLKEDILLELYRTSVVDVLDRKVQQSPQQSDYYARIYAKYLSYVDRFGVRSSDLLDVGCGAGAFLRFCAKHTEFSLHGLDVYEDARAHIEEIVGPDRFFRQRIEDVDFGDKRFGLITLWGVLEHLLDPREALKACAAVLDDDGCIILLVPNIHSRAAMILGVDTPTLNPRAHVNMYTERSLEYLSREAGLQIHALFQELPVIDLMYRHIRFDEELWDSIVRRKEGYYHVYILRRTTWSAEIKQTLGVAGARPE
jgi:2-polyprenyl-3-methyl-5-hydroxy-6-metoxy-1,4-benzoquinol methylase